jgi:uncharacterized protein (DUF58 family)
VTVLTRSGLGAAVAAVLLAVAGWWWHYIELVVIAAVVAVLVVGAVWSARHRTALIVHRRVHTVRVARGDPLRLTYRVVNQASHRSSPVTVVDRFAGRDVRTPVPPVAARDLADVGTLVPTSRRGLFELGPADVVRSDPFGLAIGSVTLAEQVPVVVHPRVYVLNAATGSIRTTESESAVRRATVDPLSGFVSLREYVPGDDPRLIHWPTTARVGALMVREHVEVRRPEFTVVLDTAAHVATPDDFEEMVDVAASIGVHALRDGLDVIVRTTDRAHPGRRAALVHDKHVLDLLTPVAQTTGTELLSVAALFTGGLDQTSVTLVTGPGGPSSGLRGAGLMTVVRVGRGAALVPGITIAIEDARAFVERWRAWR